MKVCKFCKYGYPLLDKDGLCVYCYLHFNSYPIKKDVDDTCPSWDPDDEGDLSIKNWLNENKVEGLVFWLNGEPVCKIKRTDFGYEWPVKN